MAKETAMTFRSNLLGALAAVAAAGACAAPALAQDGRYDRGGYDQPQGGWDQNRAYPQGDSLREREQRMGEWIQSSDARGQIGPGEARRALDFLDRIQKGEAQMRWRNGGSLRPDQRERIDGQLDHLARFMRQAINR
jgi:hypothetical protein